MIRFPLLPALAAGLLLIAAGCQKSAEAQAGLCDRDAAAALVGKAAMSDAEAQKLTGASSVRQVRPGDAVTMDFRQERLTIETDPATNRITRAVCG